METEETYDLVIVGGGPGGLTAGIYGKRAALKTLLIEKGAPGGQVMLSGEVENWPGTQKVSGHELSQSFLDHALSYGLELRADTVESIEPGLDVHTVKLSDKSQVRAFAVILGTGGSPRKLGIPGEDDYYGRGVSYCAVCDGFFFRGKTVVVVGGGDSACEEALYLAKLCNKVFLVHRRDALRASMILQKRVMKEKNITLVWDTVLTAILADDQGVDRVSTKSTKTGEESELEAEGVFIFIGFEPNNQLVPIGVSMDAGGFVITDPRCGTDIPGLYVIGDLRQKYAKQIVTAAGDGCTAALAAAHYVETKKIDLESQGKLPESCGL